jgi:hypothetical protein
MSHCRRMNGADNKDTTSALPCTLVPNEIFNLYLYKKKTLQWLELAASKEQFWGPQTNKENALLVVLLDSHAHTFAKNQSLSLCHRPLIRFDLTCSCIHFQWDISVSPLHWWICLFSFSRILLVPIELNRGMQINAPFHQCRYKSFSMYIYVASIHKSSI